MITNASLLKNYIFGAFTRYKAGTVQESLIIHPRLAILPARPWSVRHKLLSVHLAPMHLCTGKGPMGTFDANGMLDDFNPRARIHQPPHQAEVAPRHGLLRP